MAKTDQKVGIRVDANASPAVSGLEKLTKSMNKVGREAKKSGTATGTILKFQKGLNSLVNTYAAVAAGAVALGVGLWDTVKAYSQAEASQKRLEQSVINAEGSYARFDSRIQDVIRSQSQLSGFDDDDLVDSMSRLVQMTGSVEKAMQLNNLAMDVARGTGKDLGQTAVALGKVYTGNVGSLKKFGITVKDGATATEALGELQKKYAGQAAAYGDTNAAAAEKMTVAWGNLKEATGEVAVESMHLPEYLTAVAFQMDAIANKDFKAWWRATWEDPTVLMEEAKQQAKGLAAEMETLTTVTVDQKTAVSRLTAAYDDQRNAVNASMDAELAKLRAEENVTEKQKAVTAAVKEHGKKSREARIATLELKQAQREAAAAAQKYAQEANNAASANKTLAKQKSVFAYIDELRRRWSGASSSAGTYLRRINAIQHMGQNTRTAGVQFADGGRASGPTTGFPATLHGNEWVIPERRDSRSLSLLAQAANAIGATSSSGGVVVNQQIVSSNPEVSAMEAKRLLLKALGG